MIIISKFGKNGTGQVLQERQIVFVGWRREGKDGKWRDESRADDWMQWWHYSYHLMSPSAVVEATGSCTSYYNNPRPVSQRGYPNPLLVIFPLFWPRTHRSIFWCRSETGIFPHITLGMNSFSKFMKFTLWFDSMTNRWSNVLVCVLSEKYLGIIVTK